MFSVRRRSPSTAKTAFTRDEALVLSLIVGQGMTYRQAAAQMDRHERDVLVLVRQALARVRQLHASEPELFTRSGS